MTYRELQRQVVKELRAGSEHTLTASMIPVRPDYRTDPAMCLTSVSFVPEAMGRDIRRTIVEPLRAMEPEHHYYPPASMHITIKNIRSVHHPPQFTEEEIEKVNRLFRGLIPRHPSLAFSLEELVAFRTSVSLIGYCDERLKDLVLTLDAGLNEIGVPDDKRYVSSTVFFGNVTLCRFVRQPSGAFFGAVERMARIYTNELKVETIHLITCNSVCASESRDLLYSYELCG